MRRAVIFATLTMLLLAVAGVTVAQEGVFDAGTPAGGSTEATAVEGTEPERTVPDTTFAADEGSVMEEPPAGDEKRDEPAERPGNLGGQGRYDDGAAEPEPVEADEGRGSGGGGPGENGRPEDEGKRGNGRGPDFADKGGEKGNNGAGGEKKVSVCHKGKKTLSVGAAAEDAHLRHGDEAGECG